MMARLKLFVAVCGGLFVCSTDTQRAALSAPNPFHVIGYYADWTAGRYPLADIPAEKLTHVNYAFGKIGPDNRLTVNAAVALERVYPGDCSEPGCAHGLFHQIALLKQQHPHLKFIMSVGGWTDSGPFYEMAATDSSRQAFSESCGEFLKTYPQFDGIDIDWEHPVVGGIQPGQPRDAHNYVLLLADLRRAIGADKLLTVAVSASPRGIAPLEYTDMAVSLDWVSVMTYDFHSGGNRAGHNAPLYNHDDPSNPKYNVQDAVEGILAKGVPPGKLIAGVPFYGRGWSGVESSTVWSPATGPGPAGAYTVIAEKYLNANGYVRYWDDVAKVPWLYNAETKHWITYEDPQSARIKGEYIAARQLAGAMFWELSNDNGSLLDALRTGLGNPGPLIQRNSPRSARRSPRKRSL
jgi:chitinase